MSGIARLQTFLNDAHIDPSVLKLCPDYRVLLLAIDHITPGPSDEISEALLQEAESSARTKLATCPVTEIPHVAAWREAYKAFGAKPQKFRNSLESLTRRVEKGLPRVNRLTDIYNAVSLKHEIPLGGESLDNYTSPPFLIRATGQEDFDTRDGGASVVEHPDVGEVVWADSTGVTCRRWNWRQCNRTALTDETTCVLFVMDALRPCSNDDLNAAADELVAALKHTSPDIEVYRRILGDSEAR